MEADIYKNYLKRWFEERMEYFKDLDTNELNDAMWRGFHIIRQLYGGFKDPNHVKKFEDKMEKIIYKNNNFLDRIKALDIMVEKLEISNIREKFFKDIEKQDKKNSDIAQNTLTHILSFRRDYSSLLLFIKRVNSINYFESIFNENERKKMRLFNPLGRTQKDIDNEIYYYNKQGNKIKCLNEFRKKVQFKVDDMTFDLDDGILISEKLAEKFGKSVPLKRTYKQNKIRIKLKRKYNNWKNKLYNLVH